MSLNDAIFEGAALEWFEAFGVMPTGAASLDE
jgi:hypothetical protein